jgi:DNA-directed RNA polymerase subunit omega
MARITVEDCLVKETNRFALVQLASKRTKQILQGGKVVLTETSNNKAVVTALREIAGGQVRFMTEAERQEARERAIAERQAREAQLATQAQAQAQAQTLAPDSLFKTDIEVGEHKNGDASDVEAAPHGENGTGAA